jgi:hypothetical protein
MDQPKSDTASVKYGPKVIEPDSVGKAFDGFGPQQNEYNRRYL